MNQYAANYGHVIYCISNKSSSVAEMGDRLATIDMGRNWGLLCPFRGGAGSRLTQCGFGQRGGAAVPLSWWESWVPICNLALAEAHLRTKWHLDLPSRLATTNMGRKLGGSTLLGNGSPFNTMSPGRRGLPPYQVTSPSI